MFKFFRVKSKLMISTFIVVFGLVVLTTIMMYTITNINAMNSISLKIERLNSLMTKLRVDEKNFLASLNIKYSESLQSKYNNLMEFSDDLITILNSKNIQTTDILKFKDSLKEYHKTFGKLYEKQKEIGFDYKDGLYGSLRNSVHKVQTIGEDVGYQTMNVKLLELRRNEKDFMLRKDLSYVKKFEKIMRKLRFVVRSNKTHITSEQKKLIYASLKNYREDFLALVKAEEVKGFSVNEGLLKQLRDIALKSENILNSAIANIVKESKQKEFNSKVTASVFAIIFILFSLITSYFIAKQIISNIDKFHKGLIDFFDYINKRKDDVSPIVILTNDEFGNMADIVNSNIEDTKINLQKSSELIEDATKVANFIKQGHLSNTIEVTSNDIMLNKLKDVINELLSSMRENIHTITDVLNSYDKFDYTKVIDTSNMEGSMQRLASGVNSVGLTITKMLQESRKTGVYLENDSNSLTKYVNTLSEISNHQAASLEETAAAIEEVTINIENTNEQTTLMSNISNETKIASTNGKKLANNTAKAMEEINEQTSAIHEAITVIDQIAFQTNILSLNAAVEAATAGEAGKGFAVVAGEVRNLASRSAEAAKEIKELVESATNKADEGKNISAQMIEGFEKLDSKIDQTTKIVEEVSRTTKEQSQTMAQINDTMAQLDKNTQENAKTAENTNLIAQKTNKLAKKALMATDDKIFDGKDEIIAKNIY